MMFSLMQVLQCSSETGVLQFPSATLLELLNFDLSLCEVSSELEEAIVRYLKCEHCRKVFIPICQH